MLSRPQNQNVSTKEEPKFCYCRNSILTEEVEKRKDVIFSRQNSSVTNQAKKGEWDLICEKVNAVNTSHLRTADELKKKWSVLCSETKEKISKLKREEVRTGGGQLPADCSVTPVEDKIQSIIGETAISGIDGGIDTLEGNAG
ncbi:myb/SANT-like DNA-binding domain-containing protein 4 [Saccostrea echinata]|uniref:myb/SANT-like DNA-binding domain-containing protein 4 n=1 Tax=Saccostrea echinata TaxID=191078 RepID=UPI002A819C63|nr:myb/SANT-like DNA-binding domain-containing protein 4 [Saccostrea echinata]